MGMKTLWLIVFGLIVEFKGGLNKEYQHEMQSVGRVKRDVGFDEIHEKLTLAARVLSGIAIKIQIHEGSVNGNELFSELLNLERPIDFGVLEAFKNNEVYDFFKDLKDTDVTETAELKLLEERIGIVGGWVRKFKEIPDTADENSMDAFITDADTLVNANIDMSFLAKIDTTMQNAFNHIKSYNERKTATDLHDLAMDMFYLENELGKLEPVLTQFSTLLEDLKKHTNLLNEDALKTSTFLLVELTEDFVKHKDHQGGADATVRGNLLKIFQNLKQKSAEMAGLSTSIQAMDVLMQTSMLKTRKLTSGLVNGFKDLEKLEVDAKHPWLSKTIENYEEKRIAAELKPLVELGASAKAFDGQLKTYRTANFSKVSQAISKIRQWLPSTSNATVDWILDLNQTTAKPPTGTDFHNKASQRIGNVKILRALLSTAISKLEMLLEVKELSDFKDLCGLHKYINFTGDKSTFKSQLNAVIKKMEEFEKFEELNSTVATLKPKFEEIQGLLKSNALKNIAKKVSEAKADLIAFHKDAETKKLIEYFKELSNNSTDIDNAANSVGTIRLIRQMRKDTQQFFTDLLAMTGIVKTAGVEAKNLKGLPAKINSSTTSPLKNEADFLEQSRKFGEAVGVLDVSFKMLKEKDGVEMAMKEGWQVMDLIDSRPADKEELKSKWGQFSAVSSYFDTLMEELKNKTAGMTTGTRKRRDTPSLGDYAKKLKALIGLKDLNVDLKSRREVLRVLGSTAPTDLVATLATLDSLDLKFTAHQPALQSADGIQTSLQSFLKANQNSEPGGVTTVVPGASTNSPSRPNSPSYGNRTGFEGREVQTSTGAYIVYAIVIFLVIGVIGLIAWLLYKKRENQREEAKKEPEPESAAPVAPTSTSKTNKTGSNSTEDEQKVKKTEEEVDAVGEPADSSMKTAIPKEETLSTMPAYPKELEQKVESLKDAYQQRMDVDRIVGEEKDEEKKVKLAQKRGALEKSIVELEKQLGDWLSSNILKFARFEYQKNVENWRMALARWEKQKKYDKGKTATKRKERFESILKSPLEMCREKGVVWTKKDAVMIPPARDTKYCDAVKQLMLTYNASKTIKKEDDEKHVAPFAKRLADANQEVDALKQTCVVKQYEEKCTTYVKCYEMGSVKLSTGGTVNATYYEMPYGTKIWVAAAGETYFNTMEEVDQFIWDQKPAFMVTPTCIDLSDELLYFDNQRRPCDTKFVFTNPGYNAVYKNAQFMLVMYNVTIQERASGQLHHMQNYNIYEDEEFHKDDEVQWGHMCDVVDHLFQLVTRQEGKSVAFVDTEGGQRPAALAGIEMVRTSLSNDGWSFADVTTQLYRMLQRRGHTIYSPERVMFMVYMGVELFLKDQKQPKLTNDELEPLHSLEPKLLLSSDPHQEKHAPGKKGSRKAKKEAKAKAKAEKEKKENERKRRADMVTYEWPASSTGDSGMPAASVASAATTRKEPQIFKEKFDSEQKREIHEHLKKQGVKKEDRDKVVRNVTR